MARATFRWFWSEVSRYSGISKPRRRTRTARNWRLPLSLERLEDLTLPSAAVFTDRPDYAPGQTALITATGFGFGETVRLNVDLTDPPPAQSFRPWFATDGGPGDL